MGNRNMRRSVNNFRILHKKYGPDLMAYIRRHNVSDKLLLDTMNSEQQDKDDGKHQLQTFKLYDELLTTELSEVESESARP
jgi:hypothetical protein